MATTASLQVIDTAEWRRFGVNVPAALFGMTLVAVHPYALGVMFAPLEQEFGWTRAEISAGPLVTSITALLLAAFGGRAVDKYGPRKIALLGVPAFALALSAIALSGPSIISWLALYALLAVALILIYPSVWTAAIAQRFETNRGLALAVVLSGTGIASAFVPIIAASLIEAYGWRGAYIGMGAIAFIIQFPLVLLFFAKDNPAKPSQLEPPASAMRDGKLGDLASPKFIRLCIAGVIYSLAATGLGINAVPILMEEGFELIAAAKIAGLIGIGTITGRILGGFLLDRIDGRYVAVGCAVGALGSAAIFLVMDQSPLAASVACVMLGLTAGAEYDACAYLVSRHFPRDQFATLFAVLGGLFGFTSGVAPFIANTIYEETGSYDAILWGILPLFALSTVMFMSLGRYPQSAAAETAS